MELTATYIVSQVFAILMYILLASTYYLKNRKTVLTINVIAMVAQAISFICLKAYTGLAMDIVAIIRNIIFMIDEKKNGKSEQNTKKDIIILVVLYVITILLSVFTYSGLPSLFSVLGTFLYTYSVWQKNTNTYKLLGIPTSVSWIAYNIYIKSIFGGILESIVLICSGVGYLLTKRKANKQEETQTNIQK
ncbi:MAG: YgjV family protein [Clostridia bacterium]|nr:YgjV family protein [Clostridia bacterium]